MSQAVAGRRCHGLPPEIAHQSLFQTCAAALAPPRSLELGPSAQLPKPAWARLHGGPGTLGQPAAPAFTPARRPASCCTRTRPATRCAQPVFLCRGAASPPGRLCTKGAAETGRLGRHASEACGAACGNGDAGGPPESKVTPAPRPDRVRCLRACRAALPQGRPPRAPRDRHSRSSSFPFHPLKRP